MGKIQTLDWGTIEWIFEPEGKSADHMSVGISTMNPGAHQPRHIHMGDEQLMYIISGHGWQKIGGQETELKPGSICHISNGMAHESVNDGEEPIVKLLISIPAIMNPPKVAMNRSERVRKQESINKQEFLRETIKEIFRKMLSPLKMPLSIFDEDYGLVYSNYEFPEFCRRHCSIHENIMNCQLYRKRDMYMPPYYSGATAFVCEYGISLYVLPIAFEGELLGYIKSGHVRTDHVTDDGEELPYNVPSSTVSGIITVSHKLSEAICNHYQVCKMQVALQHSTRILSDKEKEEELLQESLRTTQDQMLNLKINQHFLFNTLSTIASMAIREGAPKTYEAVGNLAHLLRYTFRTNAYFVSFSEEIDFLKNYTNLQQIRFKNRLKVEYRIAPDTLVEEVPFNYLQPIVENCFKHGFKNKKSNMCLHIYAEKDGNYVKTRVTDNGEGMNPEKLAELHAKIKSSNAAHGTAMVVRKLESLYGSSYRYHVDSDSSGTTVTICIPIKERQAQNEKSDFSR